MGESAYPFTRRLTHIGPAKGQVWAGVEGSGRLATSDHPALPTGSQ